MGLGHAMLFSAAAMLAWQPVAAAPVFEAGFGAAAMLSDGVNKTVVSDKFRLVFVAGLEGTGHHYIKAAVDAMHIATPNLPRVGRAHRLDYFPYYVPSSMSKSSLQFSEAKGQAREDMQALAEYASGLPLPGSVYFMRSVSYPTQMGAQKVVQYVDLPRIVEEAEHAGIDMRVLYLRRSAKGMVVADTVHRDFQNHLGDPVKLAPEARFLEYIRILFTDIAVLQSLLFEVSPRFVVCHDWDRLGDQEQASEIAGFVSPNDEVAGAFESFLVNSATGHQGSDEEVDIDALTFNGAKDLVARLQRKLDSFEGFYCGPKR